MPPGSDQNRLAPGGSGSVTLTDTKNKLNFRNKKTWAGKDAKIGVALLSGTETRYIPLHLLPTLTGYIDFFDTAFRFLFGDSDFFWHSVQFFVDIQIIFWDSVIWSLFSGMVSIHNLMCISVFRWKMIYVQVIYSTVCTVLSLSYKIIIKIIFRQCKIAKLQNLLNRSTELCCSWFQPQLFCCYLHLSCLVVYIVITIIVSFAFFLESLVLRWWWVFLTPSAVVPSKGGTRLTCLPVFRAACWPAGRQPSFSWPLTGSGPWCLLFHPWWAGESTCQNPAVSGDTLLAYSLIVQTLWA